MLGGREIHGDSSPNRSHRFLVSIADSANGHSSDPSESVSESGASSRVASA